MKNNILITGAAGLFGIHLTQHFNKAVYGPSRCEYLKKGEYCGSPTCSSFDSKYYTHGIDNLQGGYEDYVYHSKYNATKFTKLDLRNQEALNLIFERFQPDYVIHTAAMAAVCLSPFIRNETYSNNMLSYSNVVNACINYDVKKLIHFSSMDVYGNQQPPFTEDMVPHPEEPYGISKYAIEQDLKNAHQQFGLDYAIIRPHNVFGIFQNIWDRYRNVLGIWIRKCLAGEDITVYGDGLQQRAISDIRYYMEPVEKLLFDHSAETYNIGADKPYTILELAKLTQKVAKRQGFSSDIVHLEPRNEVPFMYSNHDKAKKDLGFEDKTDVELLIYEMLEWAKEQPKREVKNVKYEVQRELYSYWK